MNTATDTESCALPPRQTFAGELARLAEKDKASAPAGLEAVAARGAHLHPRRSRLRRARASSSATTRSSSAASSRSMSNRGLLLVGEPGTAKSMLSELLAAAISGDVDLHHPGHGRHHRGPDQVLAGTTRCCSPRGRSPRALVRGADPPGDAAAAACAASRRSRAAARDPGLPDQPDVRQAAARPRARRRGRHGVRRARLQRDRHREPPRPRRARDVERAQAPLQLRDRAARSPTASWKSQLVREQTDEPAEARRDRGGHARPTSSTCWSPPSTTCATGVTDGRRRGREADRGDVVGRGGLGRLSPPCLDAHYFGDGTVDGEHVARQLIGTVLKDNPDDGKKLRHYFDVVVKQRAQRQSQWKRMFEARRELNR